MFGFTVFDCLAPDVAECGVVRVCHTLLSWQHFLVSIVRLHQILLFSVTASHQCPASSQIVTSHTAAVMTVLQSWLPGLQMILTHRKQYSSQR